MDSAGPTVCIKGLRPPVLWAALRSGSTPEAVLRRLGLPPELLADASARLPHAELCRVWEELADGCADPAFGILAAQLVGAAPFDLIDYALFHSATVRELVLRFARWQRLFHDANEAEFREEGDALVMVQRLRGDPPTSRHLTEFVLLVWLLRLRRVTGAAIRCRALRLRHSGGAAAADYERLFGAPPVFGAGENTLTLDRAVLDLPLVEADPALRSMLTQQVEQRLAGEDTLLGRARHELRRLLPQERSGIDDLALALGLSERTLQRRLAEEGTSFRDLLDEVRRDLALAALRQPGATVTDVAFCIGFSDLTAFSRAFRRWTGENPANWRRRVQAAP